MLTSEQANSVYSGSGKVEVALISTMIRTAASFIVISWFLIADEGKLRSSRRLSQTSKF